MPIGETPSLAPLDGTEAPGASVPTGETPNLAPPDDASNYFHRPNGRPNFWDEVERVILTKL